MRRLAVGGLSRLDSALDRTRDVLGDAHRVTRFLRGRLSFTPRPDDIYVVTYPRSGTTWMQYMLHLMVGSGRTDFDHIDEVCPWFERGLSVGSWTAEDFERLSSPRIFKSHLPWGWLPRPGRYIYVVREVVDVLDSYYRFYRRYLRFEGTFEAFFDRFMRGDLQYRSWFEHVAGWRAHADDPAIKIVRYEELRADPSAVMRDVAEFLGAKPDRVDAAVAGASIDRMKALEERFDHATSILMEHGIQSGGFIGAKGNDAPEIDADKLRALRARTRDAQPAGRELRLAAFLH